MNNYFQRIEKSYDKAIKSEKLTIIRADAMATTRNGFDLISMDSDFVKAIRETAKELSKTLQAIVYVQSDEINIIYIDKVIVLNKVKKPLISKISAYNAQVIFETFNRHFDSDLHVYFDIKTLGIDNEKFFSYLHYRFIYCRNYFISHLLKNKNASFDMTANKNNKQRQEILKNIYGIQLENYDTYLRMGCIFIDGEEIKINDDFTFDMDKYISKDDDGKIYLSVDTY